MFVPYDYQERIVDKTIAILDEGRKPLIVLGTGGGKTAIAAMIAKYLIARGEYVVISVFRINLIMQFYNDLLLVGVPDDTIGIMQGDNSDSEGHLEQCQVVIAMAQTIQSDRWADFLSRNTFHTFIGDERHQGELDGAERIINAPKNVGMTATPWKADGDEFLLNDFEWIEEITMQELINRGALRDYDHYFYPEKVEEKIFLEPEYVFSEWKRNLLGIPAIGLCKTIDDARMYSDYFTAQGYPCDVISDETPEDVFIEAKRQINSGESHVFWSVTKIATGYNEKNIKGFMSCCKRTSVSLWVQSIGRIVRLVEPDQIIPQHQRGIVLDFFNNGRRLPDPRDIVSWRDIPQASGKTCQECGLKNSTKQINCKGCGHCLINDREKDEIKSQIRKEVDLTEYVRLNKPMVRADRRAATLDRVGVAKTAREIAFWKLQCDPVWAEKEQKKHFPNEAPIVSSQTLKGAVFPSGMSPEDLAAYVEYLKQYAENKADPNAWIVSQVRAEGGQQAIDMLNIAYAA